MFLFYIESIGTYTESNFLNIDIIYIMIIVPNKVHSVSSIRLFYILKFIV